MNKVLITAKAHPILATTFTQKGYEVLYIPDISYEQVLALAPDLAGLILTTRLKIGKEVIDAAPHLKWIGRLGSGMELIDVPYAQSRGIQCESSPEGNRNAVAEQSLAMILMLLNKLHIAVPEVAQFIWKREENRGTELAGKTVGIVGFGNTGSSFAKLLQPFGVTVLAHDKYKQGFGKDNIREASLEEVCAQSNIISFNLPLTTETHHLANTQLFAQMKQQPVIINASRGKVVNTADTIAALKNGQISGACLDVLENEKLDSFSEEEKQQLYWLTHQPNVIITPHIAGYTHEAFYKMATVLLNKLGML